MKEIIEGLESIAHAAGTASDSKKVLQSVKELRARLKNTSNKQLDDELSIWESKIEVIWKEPAGRQGIAKHARHWAKELKHAK